MTSTVISYTMVVTGPGADQLVMAGNFIGSKEPLPHWLGTYTHTHARTHTYISIYIYSYFPSNYLIICITYEINCEYI